MPRKNKGEEIIDSKTIRQREIFGLILLAIALLLLFSLLNQGGFLGFYLGRILIFIGGRVSYLLPFLLVPFIFSLVRGREITPLSILGSLFVFLSLASLSSLFHLERGFDLVQQGIGGGVIGLGIAFLFNKLFSFWLTLFLFVIWFLAGSLLAFNFSFSGWWAKIRGLRKPQEEAEKKAVVSAMSPFRKRALSLFPFGRREEPLSKEQKEFSIFGADKDWSFPPIDLLDAEERAPDAGAVNKRAEIIKKTLADYGMEVEMGEINIGPTVTQFTLKPKTGVKMKQIISRSDEIAYALAAHPIRIEAPIPGKSAVGIEVPNQKQAIVRLRNLLQSKEFAQEKSLLSCPLGRDVAGRPFMADVSRMPHFLVAGATGTGKSVFLNSFLITMLYRSSPKTLRLILVDPKRVEFTLYNDIPHLLAPVMSEVDKTISSFHWATGEMDKRYILLQEKGKRNISEFNRSVKPEDRLPYIVIIIDELADFMAQARREIEASIVRLTQMARATGIHMILATQRPSTDVITGLIKANITHRVAFQVASQVDSRTILDRAGAEKLLGRGDMLYQSADSPKPKRLQGPIVTEEELKRVTNFLRDREGPHYQEEITKMKAKSFETAEQDELFESAIEVVVQERKASASLLQRRLRIGYARAARLMDLLEEKGIVGPQEGVKPRQVLIDEAIFNEMREKGLY